MSQRKPDSFFHALKDSFSSRAGRDASNARATDENVLDTELRMFFLKAGMPQAVLEGSKLTAAPDRIVYKAEVGFIGGMTLSDANGIIGKMTEGGVNLTYDGTTFESDNGDPVGTLRLRMVAKNAAELQNEFETLQEKSGARNNPAAPRTGAAVTTASQSL